MYFDDEERGFRRRAWYDTALVCENGHTINDAVKASPDRSDKFCATCGAAAVGKCGGCGTPIRGDYHVEGVGAPSSFRVPAYCHECGKAYPWTEALIRAAQDLIELSDAEPGEQEKLKQSLPALAGDTPQAQVAATRMRKFLLGAGRQVADGMKQILVQVAAESVSRVMFPGGK
jgi:hypothetical protein